MKAVRPDWNLSGKHLRQLESRLEFDAMLNVKETFALGPRAVSDCFSHLAQESSVDEMDAKVLADNCWTRASTLATAQLPMAREWALAALAGYEFLQRFGKPSTARSAAENADALRSWKLLAQETVTKA